MSGVDSRAAMTANLLMCARRGLIVARCGTNSGRLDSEYRAGLPTSPPEASFLVMMETSRRAALLIRAGFNLSAEDAELLAADFNERTLSVDDFLFHEGDPGTTLFLVESGQVEAVTSSQDGRELVFSTMGPDSILGELTIIAGLSRSAGIRAVEASVVIGIGRDTFLAHANRRPAIGLALAELCARRARELSQWVSTAAFTTVGARLSGALMTLPPASSDDDVVLHITQQALGDRLGVTRETVNKWLRSWEREGIVRLGRSNITLLDTKRLEALALS